MTEELRLTRYVEEQSEESGASLLKKEWSEVRDLIREEREAFRAEREQADAALRVERREAGATQERLRAEAENLRTSMEQLQRRVEGQSSFARGEPFAGLGSVVGLEGRLRARRDAGNDFVPAGFRSPRSSVSGDSGTASAPRMGENTVSSNVTKQIKDVPFFHGAKTEFPKFKRDLITFAKQHGLFRVFTDNVEIYAADEEKSVEEIQAMGFAEDKIRKHFLAWNVLSRTIKDKTDNDILRRVTSPTAAWRILVGSYSATTQGAKLQRITALTNRRVRPGSNPIHTLSEMVDDARDLRANGTDISEEIVCLVFLQVLPEEFDVFRKIIEREKEPLTIDGLMGELRARFDLSRKVKSRSSDTVLVASGSRREKSERVGAKHKVMGKKQSSSRGDNSVGSATTY